MSDTEPQQFAASKAQLILITGGGLGPQPRAAAPAVVSFDKRELRLIFDLYAPRVAGGEWRDYALDFTPAGAVFSIFRRTAETPLFRIEKMPAHLRRQGAYRIVDAAGLILRRGDDLAKVLDTLKRRLRVV